MKKLPFVVTQREREPMALLSTPRVDRISASAGMTTGSGFNLSHAQNGERPVVRRVRGWWLAQSECRKLAIAILCSLLFCFCSLTARPAAGNENVKQADPYAGEVVRLKNRVALSKGFVDAVRKNNAVVLSRIAVRQRLDRNGRVEAIELVQVDKDSAVAKMGFRPGDRIKGVNGIPVRELEAKQAEIESAKRWELAIIRQGKPRRIAIEVKD